jgi:hypothetical protein
VSIGALPLTSNLSRIRSATLPSALLVRPLLRPGAHWGPNRPGAAISVASSPAQAITRSRPDGAVRGFSLGCRALALHL